MGLLISPVGGMEINNLLSLLMKRLKIYNLSELQFKTGHQYIGNMQRYPKQALRS
jgi:hypothetical protein